MFHRNALVPHCPARSNVVEGLLPSDIVLWTTDKRRISVVAIVEDGGYQLDYVVLLTHEEVRPSDVLRLSCKAPPDGTNCRLLHYPGGQPNQFSSVAPLANLQGFPLQVVAYHHTDGGWSGGPYIRFPERGTPLAFGVHQGVAASSGMDPTRYGVLLQTIVARFPSGIVANVVNNTDFDLEALDKVTVALAVDGRAQNWLEALSVGAEKHTPFDSPRISNVQTKNVFQVRDGALEGSKEGDHAAVFARLWRGSTTSNIVAAGPDKPGMRLDLGTQRPVPIKLGQRGALNLVLF